VIYFYYVGNFRDFGAGCLETELVGFLSFPLAILPLAAQQAQVLSFHLNIHANMHQNCTKDPD
jgi:hypothetical protein